DFVKPFGMGLYQSGIYSGFTVRRMRLEYGGCFGNFCYSLQPEYGSSGVNGNTPNPTAPAGLNGAQSPAAVTKTVIATAFINYQAAQEFQLMAGIVQTPF